MEDLLGDVGGKVDTVVGGLSAVGAALLARLEWWRKQSKPVRVLTAVGAFLALAIVLSTITRLFT